MTITPRSALWPGESVLTSGGDPRPRLPKGIAAVAVHYTGVHRAYLSEDPSHGMVGIQAYAAGANKPWEYNWMIGHDGRCQEYAGVHQAAHSRGNNGSSFGVLFLLGIGERPTDAMIAAFTELRRELVASGDLAENHKVRPHGDMPGASTTCPGDAVLSRWDDIDAPLGSAPPASKPSQPIIEEGDEMLRAAKDRDNGNAWYVGPINGKAVWMKDGKEARLVAVAGLIDVKSERRRRRWGKIKPVPSTEIRAWIGPSDQGTF